MISGYKAPGERNHAGRAVLPIHQIAIIMRLEVMPFFSPHDMASLVAQMVNHLSPMQKNRVWSLGWEDPLEKEMAELSSILVWKIPWTRSLVDYCPWSRKESDTTEWLHFHFHDIFSNRHIAWFLVNAHLVICAMNQFELCNSTWTSDWQIFTEIRYELLVNALG